ncbi:MAG: esterase family protein [Lachnospiraceae bacterium]|nr:esterase family protein [Lachnospiraceae bacterium]
MALLEVNYVSKALFRAVTFKAILPVDKLMLPGAEKAEEPKRFKTLYLLHGLLGNQEDWISGTRIQRWAEEKDLAVIMPAGENEFYVDQPGFGRSYGAFVGQELVEMTRKMFPLSDKREDTFIGGLSMGGFGALRNGLKYADTFSHIISLSGALHILENPDQAGSGSLGIEEGCFGNLAQAAKSDKNPRYLVEKMKKEGRTELPKIFMSCGTDDSLLKANQAYRDFLTESGFDVTYSEEAGGHEWDFWDRKIKEALDWLPLTGKAQGINSGNVGV